MGDSCQDSPGAAPDELTLYLDAPTQGHPGWEAVVHRGEFWNVGDDVQKIHRGMISPSPRGFIAGGPSVDDT